MKKDSAKLELSSTFVIKKEKNVVLHKDCKTALSKAHISEVKVYKKSKKPLKFKVSSWRKEQENCCLLSVLAVQLS